MFVSIACGAISGFHTTQSPLMARCIQNENLGRRIFYGSMVAEGIVALIWAAAASSFYGSVEGLQDFVASLPATPISLQLL
jgi:carbon starvation protein CstA